MCEMQITIFSPARSKCEKYLHFRVGQIAKNNGNNVAVAINVFLDAEGIIHEKRHHYMGQRLSYCHIFSNKVLINSSHIFLIMLILNPPPKDKSPTTTYSPLFLSNIKKSSYFVVVISHKLIEEYNEHKYKRANR